MAVRRTRARTRVERPAGIRPVQRTKTANVIIYGHPGIGKTRLIGTGNKTLILRPPIDHTDSIRGGSAEEWVMRDWGDMLDAQEYLQQGGGEEWDWVWLDSISLMQDVGLDDIWKNVVAKKPHRREFGADRGEYGINMQRLAQWVRDMVGIDTFNFGITAHEAAIDGLVRDASITGPWVQGKHMSSKICACMNAVWYYQIVNSRGQERRVLRTRLTEDYFAKDQYDAFPNGRLVDPTMSRIMAAIEASRAGRRPSTRSAVRRRSTK